MSRTMTQLALLAAFAIAAPAIAAEKELNKSFQVPSGGD